MDAAPAGWPRSVSEWEACAFRLWAVSPEEDEEEASGTVVVLSFAALLRRVVNLDGASAGSPLWPSRLSRDAAMPLLTALRYCAAAHDEASLCQEEARSVARAGARAGL